MESTVIYIAAHKPFNVPHITGYVPIEVGAALREQHFGYLRDDEGADNLSVKNPHYCELTAYYWIWKYTTADIVGLCHYSRYFSSSRVSTEEKYFLKPERASEILLRYDVILPEPFVWRHHTVATGYDSGTAFLKDLDVLREIIHEQCPSYDTAYATVLAQHSASYCNMMVMRRHDFSAYCDWLFSLLFEAERRIDISTYTKEEQRIFGFMSEILLNVWLLQQNKRIFYSKMTCTKRTGRKYQLCKWMERMPLLSGLTRILNVVDARF